MGKIEGNGIFTTVNSGKYEGITILLIVGVFSYNLSNNNEITISG
jgi:hypothetical protein